MTCTAERQRTHPQPAVVGGGLRRARAGDPRPGQHRDRDRAGGLDRAPARRRPGRTRMHPCAGGGQQSARPGAVDQRQTHDPTPAPTPAAGGGAARSPPCPAPPRSAPTIRTRCGRPAANPASTAAPTSSTCACTCQSPPPPTTTHGVAEPVQGGPQLGHPAGLVRVGHGVQQVHHLVRRSRRRSGAGVRRPPAGRPGRRRPAPAAARSERRRRCGLGPDTTPSPARPAARQPAAARVDPAAQAASWPGVARRASRPPRPRPPPTTAGRSAVASAAAVAAARRGVGDGQDGALDRPGQRGAGQRARRGPGRPRTRRRPAGRRLGRASASPRSSWARIVPELPQAPRRTAVARVSLTTPEVSSSARRPGPSARRRPAGCGPGWCRCRRRGPGRR